MDINETYFKLKRGVHNVAQHYFKNGLWKTMLFWLGRLGVHCKKIFFKKDCYTFFELDLTFSPNDIDVDTTLNMISATEADIEKDYYDGWYDKNLAVKHLEQGDILLTAMDNGKMIFSQWLVFNKVDLPGINLHFDIPDTTAYMAYIYTAPEQRKKRVASRAKQHAVKYLKDREYQKAFILIHPENEPSIRVNRKVGFREYQTLYYKRFFLFIHHYHLKDFNSEKKKVFWSVGKTDQKIWNTFSKFKPAS